jgi:hypothetical protein
MMKVLDFGHLALLAVEKDLILKVQGLNYQVRTLIVRVRKTDDLHYLRRVTFEFPVGEEPAELEVTEKQFNQVARMDGAHVLSPHEVPAHLKFKEDPPPDSSEGD